MSKNMTPERYAMLQAKAPKRLSIAGKESEAITVGPSLGDMLAKIKKRSKHGAVKTVVDGEKFDSKHEATHWMALKLRERAGEIRSLRRQVRFSLFAPGGEHLGTWRADFVFEQETRPGIWIRQVCDAKSAHTRKLDKWSRTKTLMQSCHGVTVREML